MLMNYRYGRWLKKPLESIALELLSFSINRKEPEHDFLDFKQDFHLERRFQKDKAKSEELTKDRITELLERYCVAFANSRGGFLVVGVAENKKGFFIKGINYKNMRRKRMLSFIKKELKRIQEELKIEIEFISLSVENKDMLIFKIPEGQSKPYLASNGRQYFRLKDRTLFK